MAVHSRDVVATDSVTRQSWTHGSVRAVVWSLVRIGLALTDMVWVSVSYNNSDNDMISS